MTTALENAVAQGKLDCDAPAVLAQLLVAVFNEAGMIVATATDPEITTRRTSRELARILSGLRG